MSARAPITTHVLDTSRGRPAGGLAITLETSGDAGGWRELGRGVTDADGRAAGLLAPGTRLESGTYRLTFDTASYFRAQGTRGFYPYVQVVFEITETGAHYHVPLLLNPYGYSTYRGS
jgi:5-hydroxyisourate hydrolase